MITVYLCGALVSSVRVRSYAWDGVTINWGYDHGANLYGVAVAPAPDGRVAICGEYYGQVGVRVLTEDGVQLWSYIHGATSPVRAVAFDSAGNLIIGGDSSSGTTLRKLDVDGNVLWSKSANGVRTRGVAVDSSDNVIAVGDDDYVRKYDSSGNVIGSYNHGADLYAVAVDADDNIFIAGVRSSSLSTRKFNSSLSLQWSKDHGNTVYALAVDYEGNLISGGESSSSLTTLKYQPDGTLSWSVNQGGAVNGVAVDLAGNVYATSARIATSYTTMRYLPDGTLSGGSYYIDFGATTNGIAIRHDRIPSIPLGLSISALFGLREPSPSALITGVIIYRCYLTGGSGTIEIPMSSFQCRRRVDTKAWLSIVCPSATDALVTQITDRSAGQLVLKRGVKYPDGSEQLDEMMRVDYDSFRLDKGANSASGTLSGQSTETYTAKLRTLTGISYRPTTDGSRRVRCDIDTYLSPGDTADLGGAETMPVSEITIWCSPSQAGMEVAEA